MGSGGGGFGSDQDGGAACGAESDDDDRFGFAPLFVRDNLCYQCSLDPFFYLALAWRCTQVMRVL
jgi:hypothetical protein